MDVFSKEYRTTALDLLYRFNTDLTGKTAFITGCTTGIGPEIARALATANATVYISGRNATALHAVRDQLNAELKAASKPERVHAVVCDLSDLPSVRRAAAEFLAQSSALHVLVCNAGLMAIGYRLSPAGVDMQMAVNHVGHFLLTQLLTPALVASASARVVAVSSMAHTWGAQRIDYSRLPSVPAERYDDWGAYQQSKLANVLFARELHRRLSAKGVTAYSLSPGGISTGLQEEMKSKLFRFIMWAFGRWMKSTAQGAATPVYCAVAPGIEGSGGEYFNECGVTDQVARNKFAPDEGTKLWTWTEQFLTEHSEK